MYIDGITLSILIKELNKSVAGYKIEKIFSPTFDTIAVHFCRCSFGYLFASCSRNNARVHIKSEAIKNPPEPPPFCMILRKYFVGGRIISIKQSDLEKIIEIEIEGWADEQNVAHKRIVIEMMGPKSNMFLIDSDGFIIDCIYKTDKNSKRETMPGCKYIKPDISNRLNPFKCSLDEFSAAIKRSAIKISHSKHTTIENKKSRNISTIKDFLLKNMLGIGDTTAKYILYISDISENKHISLINDNEIISIWNVFKILKDKTDKNDLSFSIGYDLNESPIVFSPFGLESYKDEDGISVIESFDSANQMVDYFYKGTEEAELVEKEKSKLNHKIKVLLERAYRKEKTQKEELLLADEADIYKQLGELIISNTHLYHGKLNSLKKNSKGKVEINVIDYYSEDLKEVILELDPSMTMSENAQTFFKKYAKAMRAKASITNNLLKTRDEITYFESVSESLDHSDSKIQLADISKELESLGYVKSDKSNNKKRLKEVRSMPTKYTLKGSDGLDYEIYVGRNNIQNDHLTLKLAKNNDIWIHVKDMPGSHVIIHSQGQKIPDDVINAGAMLAAYYSKGRLSSNVAVDYTLKKYVHKPNGAKPGMVIYESQTTIWVTPILDKIKVLFKDVKNF